MQYLYQELQKKKMERDRLERAGKVKYEYDSDEDTEGGTWEHKRRRQEMEKTKKIAEELTQKAGGAHHIGDYLPPEELAKFTSKVNICLCIDGTQSEDTKFNLVFSFCCEIHDENSNKLTILLLVVKGSFASKLPLNNSR